MNLRDIQAIALARGVKAVKMRKGDLIRAIQKAEGNFECFESDKRWNCDQFNCLWREDCVISNQ